MFKDFGSSHGKQLVHKEIVAIDQAWLLWLLLPLVRLYIISFTPRARV